MHITPEGLQLVADSALQCITCLMDGIWIDLNHLVAQIGFARQADGFRDERPIKMRVGDRVPDRRDNCRRVQRMPGDMADQGIDHQLLHSFIASERVVIMGGQECEVGLAPVRFDDHRR